MDKNYVLSTIFSNLSFVLFNKFTEWNSFPKMLFPATIPILVEENQAVEEF
jgi:hypothetical protein